MNKLYISALLILSASVLFSSSNAKYTSPQSGHYQHNNHNNGGIQHRQGNAYYGEPTFRTSLIDVVADGLMPWFSTRGAKSAFSAIGITTNDAMKSLLVKILEWVASLIGEFIYNNNF